MLRFAPSTTGDMSINNLRVAIFNYILSKQLKEPLLIRIEDIDKEKSIEGKDKEILELLNLFSIDYYNVVYQSENLKYHQKMAMQLMAQKKAFSCFCSDEKLNELKEEAKKTKKPYSYDGFCSTLSDETVFNCNAPFTVRALKPENNIGFEDALKGDLNYTPLDVDHFYILNHDKTPTYNYACAIDDMLYDISTVLRSEEFIKDTPRQIHLRNQLNYDKEINYIHIPSTTSQNLVKDLIKEGFLPSAIANYVVLLGNETPKEVFTLEEAIEWFDIKKLSKNEEEFDIEKLKEINKKHLEVLDDMRLSKILGFADTDIGKLGKLFLNEASTITELKSIINSIFSDKASLAGFEVEVSKIKEALKKSPYFDNLNELENYIKKETNLDDNQLSKPLRYILTGKDEGCDISKIYPLIKNYLGEIIK